MRDEYDDKYAENLHKLDFSCPMVLSMIKVFFGTGVNVYVEDNIIRHLLTCKKCREIYSQYAKEVGYTKFNLITYAIKFADQNKWMHNMKTREYLEEVQENKESRVLSRVWTRAANDFDINKLMNMKAFRDLSLELNDKGLQGTDYSDFVKYMATKYAKHIDHLEECLLKTEKVASNEKSE